MENHESRSKSTSEKTPSSPTIADFARYAKYYAERSQKIFESVPDGKIDTIRAADVIRAEKFAGITSRVSRARSTLDLNLGTFSDLINYLYQEEERISTILDKAYDDKNEIAIRRREKEMKEIIETREFAEKFRSEDLNMKDFLDWSRESNTAIPKPEKETARAEMRNEQELRETKLLLGIMANGSVGVYLSLPAGYSKDGQAGFQALSDQRWGEDKKRVLAAEAEGFFGIRSEDYSTREEYSKEQIREFVGFLPATVDVYEDVDFKVEEKRLGGLLGSRTRIKKRNQKTGTRSLLHKELVTNGKDEPLYKLFYSANNRGDSGEDPSLAYRDDGGRRGNMLDVALLLPKSTALEVMTEIKTNPSFVRKIVKEVMMKKLGISEKDWKEGGDKSSNPISPPYEGWDKKSGGKIYIKEGTDKQGFDPACVYPLKKKTNSP